MANISLYDIKAGVRKVQNGERSIACARLTIIADLLTPESPTAVMNYTEMEAKVATHLQTQQPIREFRN